MRSIRMTGRASRVVNRQGSSHHGLRFLHDGLEVSLALEALRVELVDVLRAGRSGGEPARVGDDLQSSDLLVVAGRARELCHDGLAAQVSCRHVLRRELAQEMLLRSEEHTSELQSRENL